MTRAPSWFVAVAAAAGGVAAGTASCRPSIALAMGAIAVFGLVLASTGAGPVPRDALTRVYWRAAGQAALPMTAFGVVGSAVALLCWLLLGRGRCV